MKKHNSFRVADAFEYVESYKKALTWCVADIREQLKHLSDRMGEKPSSIHLAAYRAYEDALGVKESNKFPTVVILDQSQ